MEEPAAPVGRIVGSDYQWTKDGDLPVKGGRCPQPVIVAVI